MGRRAFFLGGIAIAVSHCLALFMAVLAAYTCSKQPAWCLRCADYADTAHSGKTSVARCASRQRQSEERESRVGRKWPHSDSKYKTTIPKDQG